MIINLIDMLCEFQKKENTNISQLKKQLSETEKAIENEKTKKLILTKEQIAFWFDKLRRTDISNYDQKQRLIDTFINAIYLYDEKIILTFNYKDGSKTISLEDIECSDFGAIGAPVG